MEPKEGLTPLNLLQILKGCSNEFYRNLVASKVFQLTREQWEGLSRDEQGLRIDEYEKSVLS